MKKARLKKIVELLDYYPSFISRFIAPSKRQGIVENLQVVETGHVDKESPYLT